MSGSAIFYFKLDLVLMHLPILSAYESGNLATIR